MADLGTSEFKPQPGAIPERLTAYRAWFSDIREKEFKQKQEGYPDYIDLGGRMVSRVNIIASVIDKFDAEKFSALTLDDGSAQIRLRAFGDAIPKLKDISSGDIILTIARLRNWNNETYLTPEIIKKVSSKHALLRRLELTLEYGKREPGEKPTQQSEIPETSQDTLKERIKLELAKLDEGEGVEVTSLMEKFGEEDKEKIQRILDDFLGEGEAYEPRPGKIKLI